MKKTFTCFSNFFCFLLFLSFSTNLLAQPANDRCENATSLTIEADPASIVYVDGDTRMAEDATAINANYPDVCSGSWYADDVWFTVTTGATLPTFGLVIQTEVGSMGTDVVNHGMAIYASCDAGSTPIDCFSDAPGRRTMSVPSACLTANSSYVIRIWSAGNQVDNQGTFRIGAYEADAPLFNSVDIVLWEEDFEGGMGDWTTSSVNDTAEVWRWYAPGEGILSAFGGSNDLTTPRSSCTAKMGLPGGWYQSFMTGNPDTIPPANADYIDLNCDLISPSIDLSATTTPISLKFDQVARKLNPNAAGNPHMYVSFSYDDGVTWADTVEINGEIAANDPARQTTDKINMGDGATGSSAVRIKFTYDMDFYYWIIDNVEVIEREANNIQANSNWYAVAHNALTPRSQVLPIGFMIDVENVGASDQPNTNLNVTVTNSATDEVFNENLPYGTVAAGAIVENEIMPQYYTPADAVDTYVATYTVTSDSVDFDETNNDVSFRFDVTENTFARDFNENIAGITPGDENTINWSYGVFYHVPNGAGYQLTDVLFNIANADQVIDGNVNVTLYKWEDQNGDGDATANERGVSTATPPITGGIVASGFHTIAAGETDVILVLENWDDAALPVLLEDNTNYIIACAFTSPAGSTTQIALGSQSGDDNNTDYQAMGFIQESLGLPFYNNFFGSEATFDTDLTSGWAWAPRIRMNIEEADIIDAVDALDKANKIEVFPNPASDVISLKLELASTFDNGVVKITDAAGKTLRVQEYSNIQNELFTYDVSSFAAGTYFVQFVSEAGTRTERFTIAR